MEQTKEKRGNLFLDGLLGIAVGDALGVPYEGRSRSDMKLAPATGMIGYQAHHQPEGVWSDDTSMALCTADSLCRGFDTDDIMKRFSAWKNRCQYTATGVVFDVGRTCRRAIDRYDAGIDPDLCGMTGEMGNGNGALMRIFPVSLWCVMKCADTDSAQQLLAPVHAAASLTHAHVRGLICCGMYTLLIDEWCKHDPNDTLLAVASRAYTRTISAYRELGTEFAEEVAIPRQFVPPAELVEWTEERVNSGGYALDTLHAALWCLLTTSDYPSCVLKAVNLGRDTDTTAAVAGGIAGLVYGTDGIPTAWLQTLKNRSLIESIAEKLQASIVGKPESTVIMTFSGEYAHLALKSLSQIELDGVLYQNAMAAYLAQKTDRENRAHFSSLNAKQARRLSKQLPIRTDWDSVCEETLYRVCCAKYRQNPKLLEKLLATGERTIIYDTTGGHDNFLGRCLCPDCANVEKQNLYGKVLMRVRAEFAKKGYSGCSLMHINS